MLLLVPTSALQTKMTDTVVDKTEQVDDRDRRGYAPIKAE